MIALFNLNMSKVQTKSLNEMNLIKENKLKTVPESNIITRMFYNNFLLLLFLCVYSSSSQFN